MSATVQHAASSRGERSPLPERTNQRTLAGIARVDGIGLFSGKPASVVMHPAPTGHGIALRRADVPAAPVIPARVEHLVARPRRTALGVGGSTIETVEHVLSALAGLGIDNALIEVSGPEVPMGDGSALPFVEAICRVGITDQAVPRALLRVPQALSVQEGAATIHYSPPAPATSSGTGQLELTYVLDYDGTPGPPGALLRQSFTCNVDARKYIEEIAPARTFSTKAEAEAAARAGLFSHVSPRDMLVIGPEGPVDNTLRFPDEPARHKLLDLLGDLLLAGGPIEGRIVAVRSGHALNQSMARAIAAAAAGAPNSNQSPTPPAMSATMTATQTTNPPPSTGASSASSPASVGMPALDVRQIADILPHRYPMLMVDRVLTLESGKYASGIKNVSINEPFFVGHYPQAPIMPGVLICEAMAQLAGLMLKDVLAHQGKVALLLAMDEVRWRRPVVPGDQLILEATANKASARMADVSCKASVDGQIAAEARLKFMVVDPAQVGPGGGARA